MKSLLGLLMGASAMVLDLEIIKKEIKENKAVLIDVREDFEVQEGMLKTATHIPLGQIAKKVTIIKKMISENKNIYLYCRSGNRSGQAEQFLKSQGLKVINLGGYEDLKNKGL